MYENNSHNHHNRTTNGFQTSMHGNFSEWVILQTNANCLRFVIAARMTACHIPGTPTIGAGLQTVHIPRCVPRTQHNPHGRTRCPLAPCPTAAAPHQAGLNQPV